jgi:hypothetical protein
VRLDVATHTKVSIAAAMDGVDKTTFMANAIKKALRGVGFHDRREGKSKGKPDIADPDNGEDRQDDAA